MKLLLISACIVVLVVASYLYLRKRSTYNDVDKFKIGKDNDTIYFRITDTDGIISSVHDSGILKGQSPLILYVLKEEYTGGKSINLNYPRYIEYGTQIRNLSTKIDLDPKNVKEEEDMYIIYL